MIKHITIALGIMFLLSCIPASSATYKVDPASLNLGTDWQIAKVDGVTALKHTSKSDGILFLDKPTCPDDFIITGKIRMNDMLSPYSGLVFGSNGPGADNYHQWRAYFADGGVVQSAWGSITGRITNLDRNKWTDFKLEKRGQNIKLYFSASLVLEGKLPNLSPDATGGKIDLFGVGDTAFANIVISYPESIDSNKPSIKLSNDNMDLIVDTHTGWPVNLLSKSPSSMQLLETKTPFVFYISDQSGSTIDLNRATSGIEDSGKLSFELTPSDSTMQDTCQASITYTAESGFIRCHAELVALKDLPGEYQIRIGFGLKPSDYDYIWYPGIPHDNTFKPTKTGYNKINQNHGSVMNKQGTKKLYFGTLPAEDVQQKSDVPWASLSAPMTVAERSDRLIAFASFDTGAPFMFAMDSAGGKGTYPMVLRFPKDITKGQRFVFDINIKTFDRPKNCYTQIMSWFLDNAYSSNPNTADSVGRSKIKVPARAMPSGLNGWGPVGSKPAPGTVLPYEKQMVQAGMAMPWWICGMSVADEMYPLDDRPYFDEVGTRWTKEQIKSELQRIMDAGISPLIPQGLVDLGDLP